MQGNKSNLQKLNATKSDSLDLNGYKNRKDIIEKVVSQINKDLNLDIAIEFTDSKTSYYEELLAEIKPKLSRIIYEGRGQLEQILYKIDVPERKVKNALDSSVETDPAVIFSHLKDVCPSINSHFHFFVTPTKHRCCYKL